MPTVEPERWYPVEQWAGALHSIAQSNAGMFDLIGIGRQTVMMSPTESDANLKDVLFGLDQAIHTMHRNGSYGSITVEETGANTLEVIFDTPYPPDLWYGVVYQIAITHAPNNSNPEVTYDDFAESRQEKNTYRIVVRW